MNLGPMIAISRFGRLLAGLGAVITWAALGVQLVLTVGAALARGMSWLEGLALYLGYFTILTNLAVAGALTALGFAPRSWFGQFVLRPAVITTIAAAIAAVGLGYAILLRGAWEPRGWHLAADIALHYVTPGLFVAVWWGALATGPRWTAWPIALIYPLVYLVYVGVRGALTGFYPYPFFDVDRLGYAQTLANTAWIALGYLLLVGGLVALGRRRGRGRPRPQG